MMKVRRAHTSPWRIMLAFYPMLLQYLLDYLCLCYYIWIEVTIVSKLIGPSNVEAG